MSNTYVQDRLPKLETKQLGILVAICLAATMTTFYTRLLAISLPDLRGIWGLSIDEGAILSTVATAPQLLIAPVIPWLLTVFGFRRILIPAATAFVLVSFIIPFVTGYVSLLLIHALLGLLLGCFVTATIMIVLQSLPTSWWIIAFAFFTFRVSLGTNTGVSLAAFYTEYLGWQWIYWQTSLIMLVYLLLFLFYMPSSTINKEMLKSIDLSGMVFFCLGITLLFIGMDQGERLNWLNSGVINVCVFGGSALLLTFCWNESVVKNPWASPKLFANRNIIVAVCMVAVYIFMLTANSMLIIQFLSTIQGLKPLQSGNALLYIALLQLLITPFCIYCIKRIDPRLTCAFGMVVLAMACYQGTLITVDWVAADFIPMNMLFAVGHPFVFLSILALCIANFEAHTASGLLAYVQTARILAPTAISALIGLFLRQQKDSHSLFLSQHLTGNSPIVNSFLESGNTLANLQSIVTSEASVLSFQDGFALCFWAAVVGLVMLAIMRPLKPTPLSPVNVNKPATY